MSVHKKSVNSVISEEDNFLSMAQFLNDSSNIKKPTKRQRTDIIENDVPNSLEPKTSVSKKNKTCENIQLCGLSQQKTLTKIGQQLETEQQINEKFLKNLSDIILSFEADYDVLKENEHKLEQLTGKFLKCMQQSNAAYKQKLNQFKEIYAQYKKKCKETSVEQKAQVNKLREELDMDINTLKQKLVSDIKHNEKENLQKYFIQAINNYNC